MNVDYSIIIPVYFNEGTLKYTVEQIKEKVFNVFKEKKGEIVLVDDGSCDASYEEMLALKKYNDNVRTMRLSRNFGQVNAIWCGLSHVKGPAIVISADGQDPVSVIVQMLKEYFFNKTEIVIATRESRDESLWRKWTSKFVYCLIKCLGNKDLPLGGFDFFLLGNFARRSLLTQWQPNTFLQVRILNLGYSRVFISYHREERKSGKSRWTFSKKMTYMIDGVVGHSFLPIRLISLVGFLCAVFSLILGIMFFVLYFFNENIIRGWTPIVLLLLFFGGIQMLSLGMLGEYLWRVLVQVRNDPPYLIEEYYE